MSCAGIMVGISVFLITGLLHPIVVKCEYHFGKECWPIFGVLGGLCCLGSIFMPHLVTSVVLAVLGFSSFWVILELFEQERRVKKGWFPENPGRRVWREH